MVAASRSKTSKSLGWPLAEVCALKALLGLQSVLGHRGLAFQGRRGLQNAIHFVLKFLGEIATLVGVGGGLVQFLALQFQFR